MQIDFDNGIIILEENEKIRVTTSDRKNKITLENTDDSIDIIGGAEIIGGIYGKDMEKKLYIPESVTSDEIVKICETWLDMFRAVHDVFKKKALTDDLKEQGIYMQLTFGWHHDNESGYYGYVIDLDLKKNDKRVQNGVQVVVNESNLPIYRYLLACTMGYYISQNFVGTKIDISSYHGLLTSNDQYDGHVPPIRASVNTDLSSEENEILLKIVNLHNIGETPEQIIDYYRYRIENQPLYCSIEDSIAYSKQEYLHVIGSHKTKDSNNNTKKSSKK